MSSRWRAEKEFWFVKIWRRTRHTVERDCDEDDKDKLDNQTAEQRTLDSVVDIANLSSLSCWRKYQFWGEAIDIDDHGNSSLWTSSFANEIAIACHIGNLGALCSCPLQRIRFGHQLERFDIGSPEAGMAFWSWRHLSGELILVTRIRFMISHRKDSSCSDSTE